MQEVDRIGKGINADEVRYTRRFRFCPSCGTSNVQQHERRVDPQGKAIQGTEFWCSLCGFSFNVRPSIEWKIALSLFRQHRQYRVTPRFEEKWFDPAIVREWKKQNEKPTAKITWPSRGGAFLADKLRAALGMEEAMTH